MSRILLRSALDPHRVVSAYEATRKMGGNSGNLLYANGVHRCLSVEPNTVTAGGFRAHNLEDPTEWIDKVNHRYDRYVMPMSNAFRYMFGEGLQRMTTIIRGLDMPVTVVGVGAQTAAEARDPRAGEFQMGRTGSGRLPKEVDTARHNQIVHDFVEAVLEKSASIGVRGEITKRYLETVGIDPARVDVIGCPSLFTWGPDLRVTRRVGALTARSRVSMNIDFRVNGIGRILEKNMELFPRLTSPVQDSNSARMILTGKDPYDMTKRDRLTPIHTGHPLYQSGQLLWYPNAWGWIEAMKAQEFAFGNRLHGNIAALLAGTPAFLLAHDSRTLEIAEYHGIPYGLIGDFTQAPSAGELYGMADYTRFNELAPIRFQTYLDFLHRNGLETIFDDGNSDAAAAFDRGIAAGKRVGAVRPALTLWDRSMRRLRHIG